MAEHAVRSYPMWLRVSYFVAVGWWLSLLTILVAWMAGLTIVGLPLMFVLLDWIPFLTTLKRS
jgi:hypothetical protein